MVPPPSFAQLEKAASAIVELIKSTPGLGNTRLAVLGDLAVCKYLSRFDQISSIDFVISKCSSPGRVKKEIFGHPKSPLVEKSGLIFYRHPTGWQIEVKFIPDWLCPYLPSAARPVRENAGTLPYLSLQDLIVFKMDACGLHETRQSKMREAREAAALLELASEHCPLKLDEAKMERVDQALGDVVEFSLPEHDKSWWQRHLGEVPDKQRSPQEILTELSEEMSFSTPASPTSPALSRHSSIYSAVSRTPSYSSTSSAHSSSSSISSISTRDERPYEKNGRPRKLSFTGKPRHKRQPSLGGGTAPKSTLESAVQRLDLGRPASPGISLTNRI